MKNMRDHLSLANLTTLLILLWGMTIAAYAESPSWIFAISTQGSGNSCNTGQCDDIGRSVKAGPEGNLYVTGTFSGTIQFAGTTLTSAGGLDMYLAKYTPTGELLWVIQSGGPQDDWETDVDLDDAGNLYVTGAFTGASAVFGSANGVTKTVMGGYGSTIFLAKYTPSGALVWLQTGIIACCAGTVNGGNALAVDRAAGTVYIDGVTQGDITFSSQNGASSTVSGVGTWHMILAKFDTEGNFQWGQVNEASPNSIPQGVAVDEMHNVYVAGWMEDQTTFSSNDGADITVAGFSPAQTTGDFPDDCFLVKYDTEGNAKWVNHIGGYKCNASKVAVSHSGEVTMGGYFGNINYGSPSEEETIVTSMPPGENRTLSDGAFTNSYTMNGILATYNTDGVLQRARRLGGDNQEAVTGLAYNQKDALYVTGISQGPIYPQNVFVSKFCGDKRVWKRKGENAGAWIGNNTVFSPVLAVGPNGRVFVTGAYQSTAQFGTITLNGTGAADIFLAEVAPE